MNDWVVQVPTVVHLTHDCDRLVGRKLRDVDLPVSDSLRYFSALVVVRTPPQIPKSG